MTSTQIPQATQDAKRLKDYVSTLIESLEKGDYAYVKNGYSKNSRGGAYDGLFQTHSRKIVSKLVDLGYEYTTNHGYGCYDWTFCKKIDL